MQVFEIGTNTSDYPYLVIATSTQRAIETLHKNGIADLDIVSVQRLQAYSGRHILLDEALAGKTETEK